MTLSTSGIERLPRRGAAPSLRKSAAVYVLVSLAAIVVDHIYALFAHGVSSAAMTWMFLYPLLGGALVYFLLDRLRPGVYGARYYRIFSNAYNSGIATLATGSFVRGILEIAGTSSPYTAAFYGLGAIIAATGLAGLGSCLGKKRGQDSVPAGV